MSPLVVPSVATLYFPSLFQPFRPQHLQLSYHAQQLIQGRTFDPTCPGPQVVNPAVRIHRSFQGCSMSSLMNVLGF